MSQEQPQDSKVILVKNSDLFKVIILPTKFNSADIYINLLLIVFILVFYPISTSELESSDSSLLLLAVIVAVLYLIFKICLNIWGIMKLEIDRQRISLTYSLWRMTWNDPSPSNKQNIKSLKKYQDIYRQYAYFLISTERRKYYISTHSSFLLSIAEVNWLSEELSQWLDLPLLENDRNSEQKSAQELPSTSGSNVE